MPRVRISQLQLRGFSTTGRVARISRLTLDGVAAPGTVFVARISRLTVDGTTATSPNKVARISQLQFVGSTPGALTPVLTGPAVADSNTTVTLSVAGTAGVGVTYTWSVVSGGVTLAGSGLTRTFTAPMDYLGRSVVVQVLYADSSGNTAQRQFTVAVRPHQWWFLGADGSWVPVPRMFVQIR